MKRFSLRTLLIVATVLALFIGYGQHRRRVILRECEALKADQVDFKLSDAWFDRVWQRTPTDIVVYDDSMEGWNNFESDARTRLERLNWKFVYRTRMIRMVD